MISFKFFAKIIFILFLLFSMLLSNCIRKSEEIKIAIVPKTIANPFWLTVKAGAEQASKENKVKIIWKGPSKEIEIALQISIIEDFITQGVDAIVMAACDAKALVPVVEKTKAAGIPVVTIDSDVESDVPISFVATDNILGGKKAADMLASLIGKKGEVGLIPFVPGAATSIERERGFKEGISKYPDIKIVSTLYCQSDVALGMQVTEDMLTAHPKLDGIFAANEPGAVGCAQALKSRGVAGEVKLVAFDAGPQEIEDFKKGVIQALVVQNPFNMGYLGVKTAVKAIKGDTKNIEKSIDTGVTVVTKENYEDPEIKKILYPL